MRYHFEQVAWRESLTWQWQLEVGPQLRFFSPNSPPLLSEPEPAEPSLYPTSGPDPLWLEMGRSAGPSSRPDEPFFRHRSAAGSKQQLHPWLLERLRNSTSVCYRV